MKFSDDDQNFVRELMIKGWLSNDQLAHLFAFTAAAVFDEFKEASEETREYWREVFVFRLEDVAPPFAPMSELMRRICDRSRIKLGRKNLEITREIYDAELNLQCFRAGVLAGTELELKSLPKEVKEGMWETGRKYPNPVIYKYLENISPIEVWPQLPEADRSSLEQKWSEEAKEGSFFESLVKFAMRTAWVEPTEEPSQAEVVRRAMASQKNWELGKRVIDWQAGLRSGIF